MDFRDLVRRALRRPSYRPVLQAHFFHLALAEVGLSTSGITIDHHTGRCFQPQVGAVPLVFPLALLQRIDALPKRKSQDYFFMGVITDQRKWLENYPDVIQSRYGRDPASKYIFHKDYYEGLCRSRFGLAPVGDCPWSYRFFEAIMADAIPVLGDEEVDIFASNFFHFRHSDVKIWSPDPCSANYRTLLRLHSLPGIFPELAAKVRPELRNFVRSHNILLSEQQEGDIA